MGRGSFEPAPTRTPEGVGWFKASVSSDQDRTGEPADPTASFLRCPIEPPSIGDQRAAAAPGAVRPRDGLPLVPTNAPLSTDDDAASEERRPSQPGIQAWNEG